MRTSISSESSKASLRKKSTDNLDSMRDMMLESQKKIDRNMSSMKNYCWDRQLRKVVIMGWATDLFDLIRTFILISANVWSDEQGQMPLEVSVREYCSSYYYYSTYLTLQHQSNTGTHSRRTRPNRCQT